MFSYLRRYIGNDRRHDAFIVIRFIIILYVLMGIKVPWFLVRISCVSSYKFSFYMLCFASNVGLDMIQSYQERMLYVLYGFSTLSLA